jgi:hypothetical protein
MVLANTSEPKPDIQVLLTLILIPIGPSFTFRRDLTTDLPVASSVRKPDCLLLGG